MGFLSWLKKVLTYDPSVYRNPNLQKNSPEMTEGYLHSGPEGYSPNTAYPDTFYGSGGNASSGQSDEGDFNR